MSKLNQFFRDITRTPDGNPDPSDWVAFGTLCYCIVCFLIFLGISGTGVFLVGYFLFIEFPWVGFGLSLFVALAAGLVYINQRTKDKYQ